MEYYPLGTLKHNLDDLEDNEKIQILLDSANALDYLHKNHIYHRDLKSTNILIDKNKNGHLIDFGISKMTNETITSLKSTTNFQGTVLFMPLEVFDGKYSKLSDIYSFGGVIFEVLTHQFPWYNDDIQSTGELKERLENGEKPSFSEDDCFVEDEKMLKVLIKIMGECFSKEPKNRPSISSIISELKGLQVKFTRK